MFQKNVFEPRVPNDSTTSVPRWNLYMVGKCLLESDGAGWGESSLLQHTRRGLEGDKTGNGGWATYQEEGRFAALPGDHGGLALAGVRAVRHILGDADPSATIQNTYGVLIVSGLCASTDVASATVTAMVPASML